MSEQKASVSRSYVSAKDMGQQRKQMSRDQGSLGVRVSRIHGTVRARGQQKPWVRKNCGSIETKS